MPTGPGTRSAPRTGGRQHPGGKAHLRLRQKKTTPSVQGRVVTTTITVPADCTDIEVRVEVENPGPAPEVGLAQRAHHVFQVGTVELEQAQPGGIIRSS